MHVAVCNTHCVWNGGDISVAAVIRYLLQAGTASPGIPVIIITVIVIITIIIIILVRVIILSLSYHHHGPCHLCHQISTASTTALEYLPFPR